MPVSVLASPRNRNSLLLQYDNALSHFWIADRLMIRRHAVSGCDVLFGLAGIPRDTDAWSFRVSSPAADPSPARRSLRRRAETEGLRTSWPHDRRFSARCSSLLQSEIRKLLERETPLSLQRCMSLRAREASNACREVAITSSAPCERNRYPDSRRERVGEQGYAAGVPVPMNTHPLEGTGTPKIAITILPEAIGLLRKSACGDGSTASRGRRRVARRAKSKRPSQSQLDTL